MVRNNDTEAAPYVVKQYASTELPPELAAQFASFVRLVWLSHLTGEDRFWTLLDPSGVTRHFVVAERGVLISHAAVGQRRIEHLGESYSLYTLGGVFTYPAFRGEGHGQRVVDAASDYIRKGTGDMGMLFCVPERWNFLRQKRLAAPEGSHHLWRPGSAAADGG